MCRLFGRALCAMALLAMMDARAVVTAAAYIDGFVVELTALQPGDGNTLALDLVGGRSRLLGTAFTGGGDTTGASLWGDAPFGDLGARFEAATVRGAASIRGGAGGPPWAGVMLHAEGSLDNATSAYRYFTASVVSNGDFYQGYSLLLSPRTALTITAHGSLTLAKTVAPDFSGNSGEAGAARAGLYIENAAGVGNGLTAALNLSLFDDAQSLSRSFMVSATAVNAGDVPLLLRFLAQASVDGTSRASVVPEPSSWVFLAAGLVCVTWRARRRRFVLEHHSRRMAGLCRATEACAAAGAVVGATEWHRSHCAHSRGDVGSV